jgi:hypothetical protein
MGHHAGKLRFVARLFNNSPVDENLAAGQREGVNLLRINDVKFVGEFRAGSEARNLVSQTASASCFPYELRSSARSVCPDPS